MKDFRLYLLASALWLAMGLPGSAQWMFERKPQARGSSFEMAESIPADAQVALGFSLKGQLDVLGIATDIKEAAAAAGDDDFLELERELGQPIEQWLELFSGRGFAALLQPEPGVEAPEYCVLALHLDHPEAFSRWLTPKLGGKKLKERQASGFRIREISDGTRFGLSDSWFFVAGNDDVANHVAATLSGKGAVLANSPLFIRAQNSLTGGPSGAFLYVDGDKFRKTVYDSLELSPEDEPGTREFAFWDYGVASVDLKNEQGDAFLAFNPEAGPLLTALRKPGRVDGALLDLLPGDQSTLVAGDAGWLAGTIDTLGNEVPALGMALGVAYTALNEYGDFEAAYKGTFALGTNIPDVMAEAMRQEMYVKKEDADLSRCESNLANLGTGLEMWSTDNSGDYPASLDKLTPNYLLTLPTCPTRGAKPYSYELIKKDGDGAPLYLVKCLGHQHQGAGLKEADYPRYTGEEGLVEGQRDELVDPDRPAKVPELDEPSMIVAVPVKSVAETHKMMVAAIEANRPNPVEECGSNLKNIATACEMYSTDHEGKYPETLQELTTDYYLYEVPVCPAAGKDTYSETYKIVRDSDDAVLGVSVYCKGHNHPELEADKPLYDAASGLETGPVAEQPHSLPSQPAKGEKQSYTVERGPKAVLDAGSDILRLGYGPKADHLLQAEGVAWSQKPKIADALSWAEGKVLYIDYLDLDAMYAKMKQAAHQAAGQEQEEAKFLDALADRMRPRINSLQGVSCLKVTDQGLHYRCQGAASTGQFLAGAVFGTLVYLPTSMAGSRSQGQLTACKSNMKNIGTGLEMWASDNGGKYPDSLSELTPNYLRVIPDCPAAGADTYSATYKKFTRDGEDYEGYEVYCKGHNHERAGLQEDHPRYNAYDGIVEYSY